MKYELLLKNGTVIDPASGLLGQKDIAVAEGKIAAIDDNIPAESALCLVNLQGLLVTPGLIDFHCHMFPYFPVEASSLYCINPDAHLFQNGVTAAVDTGTSGPRDFIHFKEQVLDKARARLFAFVNIADRGMLDFECENQPRHFVPEIAAAMVKSYPKQVIGIKTAHYWVGKPFDKEHPPWASVEAAIQAAEASHSRALIDFQPTLPERTYPDLLLNILRPGDIHAHMYAQQFPVLNEEGKVNDFLWQAKKRGILFDLGHGSGSFWFRNAIPSFKQGYLPDTLSTDLYMNNVAGPVFGLVHILSKYLSMGMELMEIIRRVTIGPADIIGCEEIGRLAVGKPADIAVLKELTGDFAFPDCGGARMRGNKRLECAMTLKDGKVVYDPDARTLPDWETAPEAYWVPPGII